MKIVLENFRCHKNRTFEFPDQGNILINGDSGKGKTSIFKAINFALFGKEPKTTTFGCKKSKVEFYYKDLTVVRTRTPNHLTVISPLGRYEDEAAQAVINDKFGVHFLQTSYLSQKCLNNFLTQTKDQRAELLRYLTVQNFNIDSLKAKNKEQIKNRKQSLALASNEYKYATNELVQQGFSNGRTLTDPPEFPLPVSTSFNEAIQQEQKASEDNWKALVAAQSSLKRLNEELLSKTQQATNQVRMESQLADLKQNLDSLVARCQQEVTLNDQDLQTAKAHLKQLELVERYHEQKSVLDKTLQESKSKHEEELEQINVALEANDYDKNEVKAIQNEIEYIQGVDKAFKAISTAWKSLQKLINSSYPSVTVPSFSTTLFRSSCKDAQQIAFWNVPAFTTNLTELEVSLSKTKQELEQINRHLNVASQQCPSCQTALAVVDNNIVLHDASVLSNRKEQLKLELSELNEQITTVRKEKQRYDEFLKGHQSFVTLCSQHGNLNEYDSGYIEEDVDGTVADLSRAKDELDNQMKALDELNRLKQKKEMLMQSANKKNKSLEYLEQQVNLLKSQITLQLSVEDDVRELKATALRQVERQEQQMASLRVQLVQQEEWKQQQVSIKKQIRELEQRLASIKLENLDKLREKISDLNKEAETRQKAAEGFDRNKTLIGRWQQEYNRYQEFIRLQGKVRTAQNKVNVGERALRCSIQFSKMIDDAEGNAMKSFLDMLNEECQRFMDVMFENNLSLKVTYENNGDEENKKYFVDVMLHRDLEEIPIESLSGGEADRCALVLFLAFNKLSKSSLLLLDECLSSLHAESVENIVEFIKTQFSDRLCLMTLHQTTKGIFDQVVDL